MVSLALSLIPMCSAYVNVMATSRSFLFYSIPSVLYLSFNTLPITSGVIYNDDIFDFAFYGFKPFFNVFCFQNLEQISSFAQIRIFNVLQIISSLPPLRNIFPIFDNFFTLPYNGLILLFPLPAQTSISFEGFRVLREFLCSFMEFSFITFVIQTFVYRKYLGIFALLKLPL